MVKHLSPDKLDAKTKKYIKIISLESKKINAIANFVTKANFNLKAKSISTDVSQFIIDYLREIYVFDDSVIDTNLDINIDDKTGAKSINRSIRPLELTSVIDNFITNSEKAKASYINFIFNETDGGLEITIEDDGKGIETDDTNQLFELGYSTTNGSGIGLHLAYETITKEMKGTISIEPSSVGTIFKISIP